MANFNDFLLSSIHSSPEGVYALSDGLIPEMAQATGFDLTDQPDEANLGAFVGHISPNKTLLDNIDIVRERLGTDGDAQSIAADWVERSGATMELGRSFRGPFTSTDHNLPKTTLDTAIFNTAVGRWQERRARRIIELRERGIQIPRAVIFAGTRIMSPAEHPAVIDLANRYDGAVSEYRFANLHVAELLKAAGVETIVVPVESQKADDIFREGLAQVENLVGRKILAVGNAPSAIQVAGQFRGAALEVNPSFDQDGLQLFMTGDSISIARGNEGPETHQNPLSALGQIARDALILHVQSKTIR